MWRDKFFENYEKPAAQAVGARQSRAQEKGRLMGAQNAVSLARSWAEDLIRAEARGPGDWGEAMRRAARRIGVSHSILRRLRYTPPKDIGVSIFLKLQAAWEFERARQAKALQHEFDIAAARGARPHLLGAAARLAGAEVSAEKVTES